MSSEAIEMGPQNTYFYNWSRRPAALMEEFSDMPNKLTRLLMVPAVALPLSACGINSVPTAEEEAKAKWADVESNYQRRADLIPNLVETVKGASITPVRISCSLAAAPFTVSTRLGIRSARRW